MQLSGFASVLVLQYFVSEEVPTLTAVAKGRVPSDRDHGAPPPSVVYEQQIAQT